MDTNVQSRFVSQNLNMRASNCSPGGSCQKCGRFNKNGVKEVWIPMGSKDFTANPRFTTDFFATNLCEHYLLYPDSESIQNV